MKLIKTEVLESSRDLTFEEEVKMRTSNIDALEVGEAVHFKDFAYVRFTFDEKLENSDEDNYTALVLILNDGSMRKVSSDYAQESFNQLYEILQAYGKNEATIAMREFPSKNKSNNPYKRIELA